MSFLSAASMDPDCVIVGRLFALGWCFGADEREGKKGEWVYVGVCVCVDVTTLVVS